MKRSFFSIAFLFCLCVSGLSGCLSAKSTDNKVPRVDAGYTHWLEQQSILGTTERLLTGAGGWATGAGRATLGSGGSANSLSSEAEVGSGIWLLVQPQNLSLPNGRSVLSALNDPETLVAYDQLGLSGLYLDTPTSTGAMWQPRRASIEADTDITVSTLAEDMGQPAEWNALSASLLGRKIRFGTTILSTFTGAGPDFLLAMQNVRQWPAAYGLINVPREHWKLLPAMPPMQENGPPDLLLLSAEKATELQRVGLLPTQVNAAAGLGWGVTGEAKGHDGVTRRWVYRMQDTPWRPVLFWDDPTATARRMITGFATETLRRPGVGVAGIHLRAVEGAPEMIASMLRDLGRLVHGEGALLVQRDRLQMDTLKAQADFGVDLMLDSVTTPSLEYAMLSGDATPLREALDDSLRLSIDHSRLLRPLTMSGGVNFTGSGLNPEVLTPYRAVWGTVLPMRNGRIQATLPALAAMRAGLAPTPELMAASGENRKKMLPIHMMALQFRAALPGVLELTGQDLMGILYNPLGLDEYAELLPDAQISLPGWGMGDRVPPSNLRGVPTGVTLYPPLMRQLGEPDSFADVVRRMAQIRKETGVSQGQVVARIQTKSPGSAAVISKLPDGGYLLVVINATDKVVLEELAFPPEASGLKKDLWNGTDISAGTVTFKLDPFACRLLYIAASSTAN